MKFKAVNLKSSGGKVVPAKIQEYISHTCTLYCIPGLRSVLLFTSVPGRPSLHVITIPFRVSGGPAILAPDVRMAPDTCVSCTVMLSPSGVWTLIWEAGKKLFPPKGVAHINSPVSVTQVSVSVFSSHMVTTLVFGKKETKRETTNEATAPTTY